MRFSLSAFFLLAGFTFSFAQNRVVIERSSLPPDTAARADTIPNRMVIDPSALVYQMKVDSINAVAEEKIRDLIQQMEQKFEDPKVEEEVGRLIGEVLIEQQMALLDLQIDRAISVKDTLLLKGVRTALEQLLIHNDVLRNEIMKQLDALEKELKEP
jgi:hypothetical protein